MVIALLMAGMLALCVVASATPLEVAVEGWMGYSHSYSRITEFILLELERREDVLVRSFKQMPAFDASWDLGGTRRTLHDVNASHVLRAIARRQAPSPRRCPSVDVTLRVSMCFAKSPTNRTFAFATTEAGRLLPGTLACTDAGVAAGGGTGSGMIDADALARRGVVLLTPSLWSAAGLLRSGASSATVRLLPHGVAAEFHPLPSGGVAGRDRHVLRRRLGVDGRFVVLHVSAMTANKGLSLLLTAFTRFFTAAVRVDRPVPLLLLKGDDHSFGSRNLVRLSILRLPPALRAAVARLWQAQHIRYLGARLSTEAMARLYQAADVFAAPYYAEGFLMPALEAMACGLPRIISAGGAAEEAALASSDVGTSNTTGGGFGTASGLEAGVGAGPGAGIVNAVAAAEAGALLLPTRLMSFGQRAAGAEADAHWETVPDVESLVELLHCAAGTGATAAVLCGSELKHRASTIGAVKARSLFDWRVIAERLVHIMGEGSRDSSSSPAAAGGCGSAGASCDREHISRATRASHDSHGLDNDVLWMGRCPATGSGRLDWLPLGAVAPGCPLVATGTAKGSKCAGIGSNLCSPIKLSSCIRSAARRRERWCGVYASPSALLRMAGLRRADVATDVTSVATVAANAVAEIRLLAALLDVYEVLEGTDNMMAPAANGQLWLQLPPTGGHLAGVAQPRLLTALSAAGFGDVCIVGSTFSVTTAVQHRPCQGHIGGSCSCHPVPPHFANNRTLIGAVIVRPVPRPAN